MDSIEQMDEIKPHSNVGSTEGGGFDIPRVETPFPDQPGIRPVSPVSVSPTR
jgi:hypothetical protein